MPIQTQDTKHSWWADVRHGGMLISPVVLDEIFPGGPLTPKVYSYNRLRDKYTSFESWISGGGLNKTGDAASLHRWLDAVLEDFLGYSASQWQKGPGVTDNYSFASAHGDRLRPNRVLIADGDPAKPAFIVFVDRSKNVGMGRGRTAYGKMLELMRARNIRLGLLTNGSQFRLAHAGIDYDSWVEWDAEAWFAEGETRQQLDGFFTLLSPHGTSRRGESEFPLLDAVEMSRTRQGELSTVLGGQVREAIEKLLSEIDKASRKHEDFLDTVFADPSGRRLAEKESLAALYQASTRIVMRLVVVLYAEARHLLPKKIEAYNSNYGIEGLFSLLRSVRSAEGVRAMEEQFGAWPRLMSLFRLIHDGSGHSQVPVPAYGGMLFRPGDCDSHDPILRALGLFEDERFEISDRIVLKILELLKIGSLKIRRGRGTAMVKGPVDFSDLRTEYIGIMYEGLLDYELKRTTEPMVFLNIGQEPVLPIGVLESLQDKELKELIKKLKDEKASGAVSSDESSDDEDSEAASEDVQDSEPDENGMALEDGGEEEPPEPAEDDVLTSESDEQKNRVHQWALKAVESAGFIKKPSGKNANLYLYEKQRDAEARKLVKQVLGGGELYLVRWGGTRKGSGTFYTKPQLAVPTVRRTLEPLLYEKDETGELRPRKPEDIISVKVCDPACGSGSFLVSALNQITDALFRSLFAHGRIKESPNPLAPDQKPARTVVTLPFGLPSKGGLTEEPVPVPINDERFEPMVKARLKRHIVERCIYGVDLNPMAVELAKNSLWIETMDEELPFGFLDHKIKAGNALVGCWFDRFQHYPILAWNREGGDKNHNNGVHYQKEEWTKKIKKVLKDKIKPELLSVINTTGSQSVLKFGDEDETAETLHEKACAVFEKLHSLSVTGDAIAERERIYREEILGNPALKQLKDAFDAWCAVWFWPVDSEGEEEEKIISPFVFNKPDEDILALVRKVAAQIRFFHWELEFPDVFVAEKSGFDAILGNPPWETLQPVSKEYFSNLDPIYRTYGKQEALTNQKRLFETDRNIEQDWLSYNAYFKAMSNWMKNTETPFDASFGHGNRNETAKSQWEGIRKTSKGFADPAHPFMHQGDGKAYTFKMFLEVAHACLKEDGRIGMIVPSGIYTDKGCTALRELFMGKCRWEWLFGFENRKKVFQIDSRFKFCPVVIEKGGTTEAIHAAFMRHDLKDWESPEKIAIDYERESVAKFSPFSKALLEIRTRRDLALTEKLYDGKVMLGDQGLDGWGIKYAQGDFNMTSDSKLFPPIGKWLERGYKPDIYGRWLKGGWNAVPGDGPLPLERGVIQGRDAREVIREEDIEEVALPLYQGTMVGQYDFSYKKWITGTGLNAKWEFIQYYEKKYCPQFLVAHNNYMSFTKFRGCKIGFRDIARTTDERTMISCIIPDMPAGNKVPLFMNCSNSNLFLLSCLLNSFSYDYILRTKLGATSLNYYILNETPLSRNVIIDCISERITNYVLSLNCIARIFSPDWLHIDKAYQSNDINKRNWKSFWAITRHERIRLRCILDAIVAELYGLDFDDLAWILRHDPSDPKGFWRMDKDEPFELRHTTLTLAAFRDLKEMGIDAFCGLNNGEGWMIPETLSFNVNQNGIVEFVSNGVEPLPVLNRLGARFLPWQMESSVEDSWEECRIHARNICGPTMKRDHGENKRDEDKDQAGQSENKKRSSKKKPENMTLIMEV